MNALSDALLEYLHNLLGEGLVASAQADGVAYVLAGYTIGGGKHHSMWERFDQEGLKLKLFEPLTSHNPKAAFEAATGITV